MRVLFITSTFPLSEKDPQVPWMGQLVRRLKDKGIDIDVLAPASRGSTSHTFYGIPVYRFRYAPARFEILTHDEGSLFRLRTNKLLFFLPFFYFLFGMIAVVKQVAKNRYDVIHVHWPFPQGILGIVAKWITHSRLVYSVYGAEFALVVRIPFGNFIFRNLLRFADCIIGISHFTKKRIKKIASVDVHVIPFHSAIDVRNVKANKPSLKKEKKRILFVGRLIERKGVTYLISAMPDILKKVDARLDIVGQGPLFQCLKDQIDKLNLQDAIRLWGSVDNTMLAHFYRDCDVFVLPAIVDKWGDTEGLGVVLLEALSYKKAVVASRVGGIADIVKGKKSGLLVSEKDVQALTRAIILLLKNDTLRKQLGETGYRFMLQHFNWDSIVEKTIELYKKS